MTEERSTGTRNRFEQEDDGVAGRPALVGWAVSFVTVVILGFVAWGALHLLVGEPGRLGPEPSAVEGRPAMRSPFREREGPTGYDSTSLRYLESYDWVDPDRRVVRIPVLRAMELLATTDSLWPRAEAYGLANTDGSDGEGRRR